MLPLCSIIMLCCNKSRFTRRALNGLLETTYPAVEVVILDNGSSDDTPQLLENFALRAQSRNWKVTLLREEENIGAIAGRNRCLRACSGDYIVFLDNDVMIGVRDWLDIWTELFINNPRIGIVGPKILFAAPPHPIQCAGCEVCIGGRVNFIGRGQDKTSNKDSREVQALISACWMLPRQVYETVGELDMLFHPVQFEDIDYCYRVRETGKICWYDAGIYVYHYENVTTGDMPGTSYRYLTVKNGLKFKKRWKQAYSRENGPEDNTIVWQDFPPVNIDAIGELEIIDRP